VFEGDFREGGGEKYQLESDRIGPDLNKGVHDSTQWIIRFTRFKTTPQEGGKRLGIGGTNCDRKVDVLGSAWHPPCRHGESADQRISLQQPAVPGRFKTEKKVS
jgi:hypothetical protein